MMGQQLSCHASWARDEQQAGAFTDWVTDWVEQLVEETGRPPLVVPVTATFVPNRVRPRRVLGQFGKFYPRLCSRLVTNWDRPSKQHLQPRVIAFRDDPRTRPGKYTRRPNYFSDHPEACPHVHAVAVIRPELAGRFWEVAGGLEQDWQSISPWSHGSLHVDLEGARRLS